GWTSPPATSRGSTSTPIQVNRSASTSRCKLPATPFTTVASIRRTSSCRWYLSRRHRFRRQDPCNSNGRGSASPVLFRSARYLLLHRDVRVAFQQGSDETFLVLRRNHRCPATGPDFQTVERERH